MERIPFRGATLRRLELDAVASAPERLAPPTARRIVHRLNGARPAEARQAVPGELLALSLLHEVAHRAILAAARQRPSIGMGRTLESVRGSVGAKRTDRLLGRFATDFPGVGAVPPGRLEDLLLVSLARDNPAAAPLHELVDTSALPAPDLTATLAAVERHYGAESVDDGPSGEARSLLDILRDPTRHAPTSLIGQLRYVRDHWGWLLGDAFADLLGEMDLAIGILAEEEAGLHRRFGGGGGPGDGGEVHVPSFVGAGDEPEAFSSDSAWMPRLVLMAKSTYVWLDQLSRRFGRDIHTLDAIPDEELDKLAGWGVTGLWLIGLWQRSVASERIKRMRGNHDAVASAYSLDDYRIADDIGGEAAYEQLRERAWARGIRLASDMVPNHMGIDSRWVIDHPEWFLSLPEPPYPAYTYGSADLSPDERVGVVLEDHYWNDSDAAVTFKRFDRWSGDERYIYHGNDGTSFPWNDTAQLDFLNPEVREHVIQVILSVARRFPVIRFDAAMVLAKKHIQRLWWPLPGSGDAIPSRAQYAMSQAEFDARMPVEFWREVVDRVAAEVPGTLLLAEAFWMLEGYFVRTLGMHRVYNSAFMHMLRDENGVGYRKLIRETLEFDPEILKRYVNFMSNPDEKTAVEQFGKGDKYFGVAMVMATIPGLPMLGHGQIEGFGEKYGMEFRRATLDEQPDPWLLERHQRELFPILHRRAWFAEVQDFLLYDFVGDEGGIQDDVFAYSNGSGPTRSLVVFHGRYGSTTGTIRESVAYARKSASGAKRLVRRSLAEGLGLPNDPTMFVAFRDARTGLEYLRSCRELWERGLWMALDAYQGHVFWEFREIPDGSSGQWRRLADRLAGQGVPSLESALRDQQLEPVHAPLRAVFEGGAVTAVLDGTATTADLEALDGRLAAFLAAVAAATNVRGEAAPLASAIRERTMAGFATQGAGLDRADRAALLGWLALSPMGELAPGADVAATSAAWFDELRLAPLIAAGFRGGGLDEGAAWAATDRIRVLLSLPRPSTVRARGAARETRLLERWLARDVVRVAMGVNTWDGVEYVDRDRVVGLLEWAVRLDAIEAGGGAAADTATVKRLAAAVESAGYRVDRLVGVGPAPGSKTSPAARKGKATTSGGGTPSRSRRPTRPPGGS